MRNTIRKYLCAAIAVGSFASTASASVIYEFVDTSGVSLAEIELQTVPAGFTDIVSYRLTSSGDALFHLGLGAITFGGFSSFWGTSILDDGHGGLMGSAPYYGSGEVLSTLVEGPGYFYTGFYGVGFDFMRASPNPGATVALGNYSFKASVPEPSTLTLLGLGLAGFVIRSRRRKNIEEQVVAKSAAS